MKMINDDMIYSTFFKNIFVVINLYLFCENISNKSNRKILLLIYIAIYLISIIFIIIVYLIIIFNVNIIC